ncbi:MAG TPA: hypothetical protein VKP30_14870 [Polyangiaceae bacterium]|nr:hypothetical protein [Polyangiaceae bacterium]
MTTELTFDVSVGNVGETDYNTVVLSGTELIVPLEMDLDDDPLQDDEVRLVSEDGEFERHIRASDPDAEPDEDNRLIHYRFRAVPAGLYRVQVNVAGTWTDVVEGLLVQRGGVVCGDTQLGTNRPQLQLAPGAPTVEETPEFDVADEPPEYLDVNPTFEALEGDET